MTRYTANNDNNDLEPVRPNATPLSRYQFRNIIFALLVNSGVIWLNTTHATHVHVCIYPATRTTPIELSWNVSKTFQAPKFFDKWSKTTLLSKLAAVCFALVLDLDLQYWNFTVGRYVKFATQLVTSYNSPLLRVLSDQVLRFFTLLYATRSFHSIILKFLWIYHAAAVLLAYVCAFLFLHFTRILYIITSDYFSFLITRFLLFISPSCLTRRKDKGVRGKRYSVYSLWNWHLSTFPLIKIVISKFWY